MGLVNVSDCNPELVDSCGHPLPGDMQTSMNSSTNPHVNTNTHMTQMVPCQFFGCNKIVLCDDKLLTAFPLGINM